MVKLSYDGSESESIKIFTKTWSLSDLDTQGCLCLAHMFLAALP